MLANPVELLTWLASNPVERAAVGVSPNRVIHRDHRSCVRFFAADNPQHPPLFCVMPLINTWSVFDLLPGKSVVQALTAAGVPVYVLDWGKAEREDSSLPLSHYVDRILGRCLDRACRHAGVPQMAVLGYCVGGTMLAVHLSRFPERVSRAFFLATPIDFAQGGRLRTWANPETFPLDAIVDGLGNFPKAMMQDSFRWMRPMGLPAKYRGLGARINDPQFRELWAALERWNGDGVDFPGEAYREYIRNCYFENRLVEGGWVLDGRPVDLRRATLPATVLAATEDHIVPVPAATALSAVWGGPVQTQTIRGGHIGICAGKALPAAIVEWVAA
jgi:polyhydroxyalkanoate synthase